MRASLPCAMPQCRLDWSTAQCSDLSLSLQRRKQTTVASRLLALLQTLEGWSSLAVVCGLAVPRNRLHPTIGCTSDPGPRALMIDRSMYPSVTTVSGGRPHPIGAPQPRQMLWRSSAAVAGAGARTAEVDGSCFGFGFERGSETCARDAQGKVAYSRRSLAPIRRLRASAAFRYSVIPLGGRSVA